VSRLLFATLAVAALSLSLSKIAHATWEVSGASLISSGVNDGVVIPNGGNFADDYTQLGGGCAFTISDPSQYIWISHERTYRIYYQWTGSSTPTTIAHVPITGTVGLSITNTNLNLAFYVYVFAEVNNISYSMGNSPYSPMPVPSIATYSSTWAGNITMTSSTTAYTDISWKYGGQVFSLAGGLGGGIANANLGLGTPY